MGGRGGDDVEILVTSLTERESALLRETGTEVLRDLDEDALIDLHQRVRRARDRQVKIYRRQAAALVPQIGGRGAARPKNTRNRGKAEVFEDALARVSRRLATVARASAAALRAERLAEARRTTTPRRPAGAAPVAHDRSGPQVLDRRPDGPGLRKRHASERAVVARQQARRDAR